MRRGRLSAQAGQRWRLGLANRGSSTPEQARAQGLQELTVAECVNGYHYLSPCSVPGTVLVLYTFCGDSASSVLVEERDGS